VPEYGVVLEEGGRLCQSDLWFQQLKIWTNLLRARVTLTYMETMFGGNSLSTPLKVRCTEQRYRRGDSSM
jgi:hypothetical protein